MPNDLSYNRLDYLTATALMLTAGGQAAQFAFFEAPTMREKFLWGALSVASLVPAGYLAGRAFPALANSVRPRIKSLRAKISAFTVR